MTIKRETEWGVIYPYAPEYVHPFVDRASAAAHSASTGSMLVHRAWAPFPPLSIAWSEGYAAGQDSLSGPTGEYVDDPRLKNPYDSTPYGPEPREQEPVMPQYRIELPEHDEAEYEAYAETANPNESPFVVHAYGMDDIFPARTWVEACALAIGINVSSLDFAMRNPHTSVYVWATAYSHEGAIQADVIVPSVHPDGSQ